MKLMYWHFFYFLIMLKKQSCFTVDHWRKYTAQLTACSMYNIIHLQYPSNSKDFSIPVSEDIYKGILWWFGISKKNHTRIPFFAALLKLQCILKLIQIYFLKTFLINPIIIFHLSLNYGNFSLLFPELFLETFVCLQGKRQIWLFMVRLLQCVFWWTIFIENHYEITDFSQKFNPPPQNKLLNLKCGI